MKAKEKMRDEMFKYKMRYKGFKQFTLEEIGNVALMKWRRRVNQS